MTGAYRPIPAVRAFRKQVFIWHRGNPHGIPLRRKHRILCGRQISEKTFLDQRRSGQGRFDEC